MKKITVEIELDDNTKGYDIARLYNKISVGIENLIFDEPDVTDALTETHEEPHYSGV